MIRNKTLDAKLAREREYVTEVLAVVVQRD